MRWISLAAYQPLAAQKTVPSFQFWDQDSVGVNNKTFQGELYVVYFFFATCQTICPKMAANCVTLNKRFAGKKVNFMSVSISPRYDTKVKLWVYKNAIEKRSGVTFPRWRFVRSNSTDAAYELADAIGAASGAGNPYAHDGRFFLVSKTGQVIGWADGTDAGAMPAFGDKIEAALK
jgi:protein SCO1/2